MPRTRIAAIGLAVLAVLAIGAIASFSLRGSTSTGPGVSGRVDFTACALAGDSTEKSKCLLTTAEQAFSSGQVPLADILTTMDTQVSTVPGLRGADCHGSLHYFGREVFAKLGNAGFAQGSTSCMNGFYHGMLEAGGDINAVLPICENLTSHTRWECMHGIGHSLWYAHHDAATAVAACPEDGLQPCMTGVYMAVTLDADRAVSSLAACEDPRLVGEELAACYYGGLMNVASEHPAEAVAWCAAHATTPEKEEGACWTAAGTGIGGIAGSRFPQDTQKAVAFVTRMCQSNAYCLDSAANNLHDGMHQTDAANQLCTLAIPARPAGYQQLSQFCQAPSTRTQS